MVITKNIVMDGINLQDPKRETRLSKLNVMRKDLERVVPPTDNSDSIGVNNAIEELPEIREHSDGEYLNFIRENHSINDSSKDTTINKVLSAVTHTDSITIHELLSFPHEHGPKILEIRDLHKRKNMLVGILSIINFSGIKSNHKPIFNAWYKYFKRASGDVKFFIESNQQSDRQKENHVSWEDVLAKRDSLPYGSNGHLILCLYSMIPPRRQLDYMNMRIYTNSKRVPKMDHNHLHVLSDKYGGPYMFIKDFKNSKFMNPFFERTIPVELIFVLAANLKMHPRNYVLTKNGFTTNEPYDDSSNSQKYVNRLLRKLFGKAVTVGTLRHSFAIYMNKKSGLTLGQKKKLAWQMGHSFIQNLEYAHNVSDDDRSDKYKISVMI